MLRTVNRVLTVLVGLVLLALGLAVLFAGLDLPRRWNVTMPSGWPWTRPRDVVLSDADRTRWTDEGWWWPVALAVLAVLFLLCVWWLLAQLRRQRLDEVLIDSRDGEGATLRARAMEDVIAAEAESQPGVDRARVALTGRRRQPRARIGLVLTAHAEPGPAVHRLRREAIGHAMTSAGLESLPAEVRMRAARHRAERVS
ncbi:alkaline shock response membrane anchor protein AmaP [Streptomyces smyrnaeus]|uniref:alkaline shock response membrane anchor protein AmaP n=1 Tax=Streptomyces TaxID=1883 RepID=UPI000C19684C|nr:alkaline shock response membrane anchor protein AmaP [Streptomyces sp. RK75]MBQ0865053.1 alkaline shock response membrane anchor protein AmaP [Streptomyces sp. RK75]MBQ1156790.1 alkaline shock response membrane anchor protein AmaP [Streptomyces sp. A73]